MMYVSLEKCRDGLYIHIARERRYYVVNIVTGEQRQGCSPDRSLSNEINLPTMITVEVSVLFDILARAIMNGYVDLVDDCQVFARHLVRRMT